MNKLNIINYFLLLFLFSFNIHAQKFEWLELIGSNDVKNFKEMKQDGHFVYVAGEYNGTLNLGSTSIHSTSTYGVFLAQYDTLGNLNWVKSYTSSNWIGVDGLTTDANGNVYMAGLFSMQFIFDNDTLTSFKQFGRDAYICSYTSSGQERWVQQLSLSTFTSSNLVETLSSDGNQIYVTGNYEDSLLYNKSYLQYGKSDSYLLKLDTNGNLIWDKKVGFYSLSNNPHPSFITDFTAKDNYIYLTGIFTDTFKIDTFTVYHNTTGSGIFVAKLDSSGKVLWLNSAHSNNSIYLSTINTKITADKNRNVYFGGYYRSDITYDTTSLTSNSLYTSLFIFKLNASGNVIYGNTFYAEQEAFIEDIEIGIDQSLYAVGTFQNTLYIQSDTITGNGHFETFVVKYDSIGNKDWLQTIGGSGSYDRGLHIETNVNGSAYVSGNYEGLTFFGTRLVNSTTTFRHDLFVTKLIECNNFQANITALNDTALCGNGASVQLITNTGQDYRFQWYKNNQVIPGETFPILMASDSGSYYVIVNNNGCIDTSRSISVSVDTIPTVSLLPFDTICANEPAFMLSGGSPQGGIWFGSGVKNGIFDPAIADTGWIQISYSYSNGNCSDTATQNMYVSSAPTASISGPKSVCAFSTGNTYSASGSAGLSYNWNVTGGSIASGQNSSSISVDWGSAGNGIITLTAIKSAASTSCDTIIVQDTVIIDNQQINAAIIGADTVCANSTGNVYSTPANGILYQWQITGGQITSGLNTSSISVNWNTAGQGTLYLRVFNSCFNDTIVRDTVLIQSSPSVSITGPNSVCSGETGVNYTSLSSSNNYNWSVNGGSIATGQGSSSINVDWGNAQSGTVTLTETNNKGCSGTTTLSVNLKPKSNSSVNASICSGDTYIFNGRPLAQAGTYYDTLTASNVCDSIVTLSLMVNNVDVSVSTYTDTLFAHASPASFQWFICDQSTNTYTLLSGETSALFVAQSTGDFAVEVTQNGCTDTSACYPIIPVGINETNTPLSFNVFPNPTKGVVYIQGKMGSNQELTINVYNMVGKQIQSKKYRPSAGELNESLDLNGFSKGIYFIEVNSGEIRIVERVVLQ